MITGAFMEKSIKLFGQNKFQNCSYDFFENTDRIIESSHGIWNLLNVLINKSKVGPLKINN